MEQSCQQRGLTDTSTGTSNPRAITRGWSGAEGIRQLSPQAFDAINVAEECVDEIARQFMAGQATEAQFLAAVSEYEAVCRVGAALIEASDGR